MKQTIVLLVRLCPVPLGEILNGPTRDIVLTNVRAFTSEVVEKTQQVRNELLKQRDRWGKKIRSEKIRETSR